MARWRGALMGLGLTLLALPGTADAQRTNRTEVKLEKQIQARLANDDVVRGKVISVDVHGDVAILGGRVDSEGERQRADQLARVDGVNDVDNQIVVAPAPPAKPQEQTRKDAERARDEQVRRALSDPRRIDPLVGQMPFENTPDKQVRLRTMGMP